VLEATSTPAPQAHGGLVTVLELRREAPGIAPGALAALTPREAEVAALVVDGLADREIAERLYRGHYTVSQHGKRICRLGVDSRIALSRLLLGARGPVRRGGIQPAGDENRLRLAPANGSSHESAGGGRREPIAPLAAVLAQEQVGPP